MVTKTSACILRSCSTFVGQFSAVSVVSPSGLSTLASGMALLGYLWAPVRGSAFCGTVLCDFVFYPITFYFSQGLCPRVRFYAGFTSTTYYNFQQWMSRLPWWWRTRWNAITIVTCSPSWIIIFLNAYCAPWIFQGVFLFECDLNPNQLLVRLTTCWQAGLWHCRIGSVETHCSLVASCSLWLATVTEG